MQNQGVKLLEYLRTLTKALLLMGFDFRCRSFEQCVGARFEGCTAEESGRDGGRTDGASSHIMVRIFLWTRDSFLGFGVPTLLSLPMLKAHLRELGLRSSCPIRSAALVYSFRVSRPETTGFLVLQEARLGKFLPRLQQRKVAQWFLVADRVWDKEWRGGNVKTNIVQFKQIHYFLPFLHL